jgi:hypothetical protein
MRRAASPKALHTSWMALENGSARSSTTGPWWCQRPRVSAVSAREPSSLDRRQPLRSGVAVLAACLIAVGCDRSVGTSAQVPPQRGCSVVNSVQGRDLDGGRTYTTEWQAAFGAIRLAGADAPYLSLEGRTFEERPISTLFRYPARGDDPQILVEVVEIHPGAGFLIRGVWGCTGHPA